MNVFVRDVTNTVWPQQRQAIQPKFSANQGLGASVDSFSARVTARPASVAKPSPLNLLRFGGAAFESWPNGSRALGDRTQFKVWAPRAQSVELVKIRHLTPQEAAKAKQLDVLRKQDALLTTKREILKHQNENLRYAWNLATQKRNDNIPAQLASLDSQIPAIQAQIQALAPQVPSLEARVTSSLPMESDPKGNFYLESKEFRGSKGAADGRLIEPGSLYMYRLNFKPGQEFYGDKSKLLKDPYSRFQPEGVDGPSEVIASNFHWDPKALELSNQPIDVRKVNIYRLHVGTFSQEGNYDAVIKKLDDILDQGYTALEIMPVHGVPGDRNWGYDPSDYYAPTKAYGRPDDLKRLINESQKRGMRVFLDVVYNHFGPEGNYFSAFDSNFTVAKDYNGNKITPWGDTFNYNIERSDIPYNAEAMNYVINNAKQWIEDFHVNGFRFDQTAPMPNSSLRQINNALYKLRPSSDPLRPKLLLMAEDGRGENFITDAPHPNNPAWGGLGFKASWSFGFYKFLRTMLTGQAFDKVKANVGDFATMLWHGDGRGNERDGHIEHSYPHINDLWNTVNFPESHDEAGNHNGARVHALLDGSPGKSRLAVVLPKLVPGIPYNFMGHEYGEKAPFYYFTDHSGTGLIQGMTWSRWFAEQPDTANEPSVFEASKLTRKEIPGLKALDKAANLLRQSVPALWQAGRSDAGRQTLFFNGGYTADGVLGVHRKGFKEPQAGITTEDEVYFVTNTSDKDFPQFDMMFPDGKWEEILNTEDKTYSGREGWTNAGKTFTGKQTMILPANSVAVFRKK